MRIEWIEVENFKGFDKRRFEFDEHFTLIVGENGSGKTSLLDALAVVLGGYVGGVMPEGALELLPFIRWKASDERGVYFFTPIEPLIINASVAVPLTSGDAFRVPIRCSFQSADDKAKSDLIDQFKVSQTKLGALFTKLLPVCAYYGEKRLLGEAAVEDWNSVMTNVPKRFDGYLEWSKALQFAKSTGEWMAAQEAISFQEGIEPPVAAGVRRAMADALPGCDHVRFSAKYKEPVVTWSDGSVTGCSNLSAGQKLILLMAADIARRCAMLNPSLGLGAAANTPGVVLIDEIDLHLHPRWQRRIMEDLRRVFPKIQFIATTHSPIIISAAKDSKVIVLEENGTRELNQAYGMDVNWVVEAVQGAESQAHEVVQLIRKIEDLIEEARLDEARRLIPELEMLQNGPSPDSVRLNAEMDNLIALANAED